MRPLASHLWQQKGNQDTLEHIGEIELALVGSQSMEKGREELDTVVKVLKEKYASVIDDYVRDLTTKSDWKQRCLEVCFPFALAFYHCPPPLQAAAPLLPSSHHPPLIER